MQMTCNYNNEAHYAWFSDDFEEEIQTESKVTAQKVDDQDTLSSARTRTRSASSSKDREKNEGRRDSTEQAGVHTGLSRPGDSGDRVGGMQMKCVIWFTEMNLSQE